MTRDQPDVEKFLSTSTRRFGMGVPAKPPPREPLNWPIAVIGIGALLFLGWVAWLVVGLIRDLAG